MNGPLSLTETKKEDARREALLDAVYDPLTGGGSTLPRVPVDVDPDGVLDGRAPARAWVPRPMADVLGATPGPDTLALGVVGAARAAREDPAAAVAAFEALRYRHDYEFWAATCAHIIDKEGRLVPLVLNAPQRLSLADREAARMEKKPVRQIELKHRQYGSSTEKQAYAYWLMNVVAPGEGRTVNACIVSLDQAGAADIAARYDRIADRYPGGAPGRATFKGVLGARNTRHVLVDGAPGGTLYLGSAERPNAPSGRTVQVLLVSEAGKMGSTATKGAGRLFTNLMSTVPLAPGTCVMVESTAEASGAWFRRTWEAAVAGHNAFRPTFIGWLSDPQYRLPLTDEERDEVAKTLGARGHEMDGYERTLWERGATLSQIAWARVKRGEYDHLWAFLQEMPSDPTEAWQAGARPVFPAPYVAAAKRHARPPVARGELTADASEGPDALRNVRFVDDPRGRLLVWRWPGDPFGGLVPHARPEEDETVPLALTNRYAAASDIGGRHRDADWSVTAVLDRAPRLWGGRPEVACEWRGHDDPDRFAWTSARICAWYGAHPAVATPPLWAPEVNAYVNRAARLHGEAWDGTTILDTVRGAYPHVFQRDAVDSATGAPLQKLGFHMNAQSKGVAYALLLAALRAHLTDPSGEEGLGYTDPSAAALDEIGRLLYDARGAIAAPEREHDDLADTRAILLYIEDRMPPVRLVPRPAPGRRSPTRRGVDHATFG